MPLDTATKWSRYCDHLQTWFYQPDLEALRILTSNFYAHMHLQDSPAWIFLLGASGSGKTTLGIYPYDRINRCFTVGDITPPGLLSVDKTRRQPVQHGLLVQSGNSAIWQFKDFTTMLSKHGDVFIEVMSKLREIHDGSFSRDLGQTTRLVWQGRITCHVACTNAIETRLAAQRDFGERFLILRWPSPPDALTALAYARRQIGREHAILDEARTMMTDLLSSPPTVQADQIQFQAADDHRLNLMAIVLAKLSREGQRNARHGLESISDEGFPSRIIKAVHTIIRGHALLFNHQQVGPEELAIAYRLVLSTIPTRRLTLLKSIPLKEPISIADDLLDLTKAESTPIPKSVLYEEIEVLEHIKVVEKWEGLVSWTKSFRELLIDSGIHDYMRPKAKLQVVPAATRAVSANIQ